MFAGRWKSWLTGTNPVIGTRWVVFISKTVIVKTPRQPKEGFQFWDCEEDRALGQVCFASQRSKWGRIGWLLLGKAGMFYQCISQWGNHSMDLINSLNPEIACKIMYEWNIPRNRYLAFIRFSRVVRVPLHSQGLRIFPRLFNQSCLNRSDNEW